MRDSRAYSLCNWGRCLLLLLVLGLYPRPAVSAEQPFSWKNDPYWQGLEIRYRELRQSGCQAAGSFFSTRFLELETLLRQIDSRPLSPDALEFLDLERRLFELGPVVGACSVGLPEYIRLVMDIRAVVKRQSQGWDMGVEQARVTLYRLLYGGRAALEEVLAQSKDAAPALILGTNEPSATPAVEIGGVHVHSGDILVSRGGAATSALIARGNDFPGNFSHIAFVYVDPVTTKAMIVESHIEVGVVVSSVEKYFADKKLRVMLLRLRADLPLMQQDPLIPHKAAGFAYERAVAEHIPYDFAMDYKDHSQLFCSEVVSAAYEQEGVHLWSRLSHMSSPGLQRWLKGFGVRFFETQEPSDLEYDPQLRVVAEWRDLETLRQDRMDNAVTDVMLEGAEAGDDLLSRGYLLPVTGLAKGVSVIQNIVRMPGIVPEGMSASAALQSYNYDAMHKALKERLVQAAADFYSKNEYEPPYWVLVRLAREEKNK